MRRPRVLLHCSSLRNPFIEAWFDLLGQFADVVVLTSSTLEAMPSALNQRVVSSRANGAQWRTECEKVLGGDPDWVFLWWGMAAAEDTSAQQAWPGAKTALCVDTFPNASVYLAEVRERWRAFWSLNGVDLLVNASDEMAEAVRRQIPTARSIESVTVTSPFPARAHSELLTGWEPGGSRLCFVGRSDFLFSSDRRMAKDAMGSRLLAFRDAGAEVFVQRPGDEEKEARLAEVGFSFYPAISRDGMMNGAFADMLSRFNGHVVDYSPVNGTVRRRVEVGLSTRFATGLCSPVPMIIRPEARFAVRLFDRWPLGVVGSDPNTVMAELAHSELHLRQEWRMRHSEWAGEAFAPALARAMSA